MDLRSGYNNVWVKDGDQWKAAFKINWGLFESTVMFFGLCNSPATFQAMMNNLFKDMIIEGWIIIYMDDILLYSSDPTIHKQRTCRVIERLKENDLFLKPEKCVFDASKVEFLEMLFFTDTIKMDPAKLKGIREWPALSTVKGVRSFLGFANFYWKFIYHYSELARPLHELMKKDKKWNWIEECQKAFNLLKEKFTSVPVLQIPDSSKLFEVESDASKFACRVVLRQQDINED